MFHRSTRPMPVARRKLRPCCRAQETRKRSVKQRTRWETNSAEVRSRAAQPETTPETSRLYLREKKRPRKSKEPNSRLRKRQEIRWRETSLQPLLWSLVNSLTSSEQVRAGHVSRESIL